MVTKWMRSPNSQGHRTAKITKQSMSPNGRGHQIAKVTKQSWSPNSHGHQMAKVTKQSMSPNSQCHQMDEVTKWSWSPNGHGHQTVKVTKWIRPSNSQGLQTVIWEFLSMCLRLKENVHRLTDNIYKNIYQRTNSKIFIFKCVIICYIFPALESNLVHVHKSINYYNRRF